MLSRSRYRQASSPDPKIVTTNIKSKQKAVKLIKSIQINRRKNLSTKIRPSQLSRDYHSSKEALNIALQESALENILAEKPEEETDTVQAGKLA